MNVNEFVRRYVLAWIPWLRPTIVVGAEHLPRTGPYIIAAGPHTTFLESLIIPASMPDIELSFLAKAELWKNPIIGWVMTNARQIPVTRTMNQAEAIVEAAANALNEGRIVVVYPEATRGTQGKVHRGKASVVRAALRAGVPIIPLGLHNMQSASPFLLRILSFGEPIWPQNDLTEHEQSLAAKPVAQESAVATRVTREVMEEIAVLSLREYSHTPA